MKDIINAHSSHLTLEMNNRCFEFVNLNGKTLSQKY